MSCRLSDHISVHTCRPGLRRARRLRLRARGGARFPTPRSAFWWMSRIRWLSTPCSAGVMTKSEMEVSAEAGGVDGRRLCAVGSGIRQGCVALTTRAVEKGDAFVLNGRKLWITNAGEADLFVVFATVNPEAGYRGITAFLVERDFPGFAVGKKEESSGSCEQHMRTDARRLPRTEITGARRNRQRLQDRHRNPERRPHRHRRPDARPGARRARTCGRVHERTQTVRQGDREFQGVQFQLARAARKSKRRSCSSTTRAPARRGPAVSQRSGDIQRTRRNRRKKSRRSQSTCSAATASRRSIRSRSCIATRRSGRSTRGRPRCSCRRSRRCCCSEDAAAAARAAI